MPRLSAVLLAGLASLELASAAVAAAPPGRPVPTETIIIPPDGTNGAVMPDIPPDAPETVTPDMPGSDTGTPDAPTDPAATPPEQPAANEPLPTIEYDVEKLPAPVKRLRQQIMDAALTGDIEKLKPIIDANGEPPQFGFTEADDPLEYLKSQSGDPEGREILAILLEVLQAGYVHVDVGSTEEMYIWPYFARYPLNRLSGPQMVELFKIITAGDYEDMKADGNYLFYRAGITPAGVWKYFVSGD
jgi:hypothetical protein